MEGTSVYSFPREENYKGTVIGLIRKEMNSSELFTCKKFMWKQKLIYIYI